MQGSIGFVTVTFESSLKILISEPSGTKHKIGLGVDTFSNNLVTCHGVRIKLFSQCFRADFHVIVLSYSHASSFVHCVCKLHVLFTFRYRYITCENTSVSLSRNILCGCILVQCTLSINSREMLY